MVECPHCTQEVPWLSEHYNADAWTCQGLPEGPCDAAIAALNAATGALDAATKALDLANPDRRKRHRVMEHVSDAGLSVLAAIEKLRSMRQKA
jgi:hypothetical protein